METNEAVGDAQAIAVGLGQFRMGRGRGMGIRLLESPRLFEMSTSWSAFRKRKARGLSPSSSKLTTLPPSLICRRASVA